MSYGNVKALLEAGIPVDEVAPGDFWRLGGPQTVNGSKILDMPIDGLYYRMDILFPRFPNISALPINSNLILDRSLMLYLPSIPGSVVLVVLFGLLFIANLGLGIRGRTWSYMGGMIFGAVLESLGYVGRILISGNNFDNEPFSLYLICSTIAPSFIIASIHFCMARILIVHGAQNARLKPRTYTIIFIGGDFFSLVLQAIGGAIATAGDSESSREGGIKAIVVGLIFQLITLTLFGAACADFALRVLRNQYGKNSRYRDLRNSTRYNLFLVGLSLATVTIYARTIYRVAELKAGFHSMLANNEVAFMILEGGMVGLAVLAMTIWHPAVAFGEYWRRASPTNQGSEPDRIENGIVVWDQSITPSYTLSNGSITLKAMDDDKYICVEDKYVGVQELPT